MEDNKEKEEGKITFRPGKDGLIEAVKDGQVVGYVMADNFGPINRKRNREETDTKK